MHNTILQRVKKLNRKSASPPSLFKKTCPCTIIPPHFLIFQIPPSEENNWNLLPFSSKRGSGGEGGGQNYGIKIQTIWKMYQIYENN